MEKLITTNQEAIAGIKDWILLGYPSTLPRRN